MGCKLDLGGELDHTPKLCGLCGEWVKASRWVEAPATPGRGACLLCLVEARKRLADPRRVVPFCEKTRAPRKKTTSR